MATEKRLDLIDRKELIASVQKKSFAIGADCHPYEAVRIQGKFFRECVDTAPTVDAVEVVRCKDCKHRTLDFFGGHCCKLHKGLAMVTDESFCSYGERRCDNEVD